MNTLSHTGAAGNPPIALARILVASLATLCLTTLPFSQRARADRMPTAMPGQAAASAGTVDDSTAGWTWSGMDEFKDPDLHGGAAHAGRSGSYAAITFTGTGATVYGISGASVVIDGKAHRMGKARLSVDGAPSDNAAHESADRQYDFAIGSVSGLKDGNHVLQVDAVGGWLVVDYIKVQSPSVATTADMPVAAADPLAVSEGDYLIMPKHAPDKCLEVGEGGTQDGAKLQIFRPVLGRPQVWHVTPLGDDLYKVSLKMAPDEVLCLKVPTQADWAPRAFLWHNFGDPTQRLRFTPVGPGLFRIAPSNSPQTVLDTGAQGTTDGTPVDSYGWWGAGCQQWSFRKVTAN